MNVTREEFEQFKNQVTSDFDDVKYQINKMTTQFDNLESALQKLMKKDYSYKDVRERNQMIVAAYKFAQWKRKKIAKVFNISESQISNILNNPIYS